MDKEAEDYQKQVSIQLQAAYEDLHCLNAILANFAKGIWNPHAMWVKDYLTEIAGESFFRCACPSCGAANHFRIGELEKRCAHCRAELFPGNERGLAAARAARRYAYFALIRGVREQFYSRICDQHFGISAIVTIFLFMLTARASLIHWLIGILISAGVFGAFFFIRKKQEELTTSFCRLSDGELIRMPKAIFKWLNRYWPGKYLYGYFPKRYRTFAIKGRAKGFPLLVWFDAMRFLSEPKIHIFLSAWVPGVSDNIDDGVPLYSNRAEEIKSSLEADGDGYIVQVQESGILLQATPTSIREGIRHPQRFFDQLPEVLTRLTDLAEAHQCSPTSA